MAAPISPMLKWKKIASPAGPNPRPCHGHRAISIKDLMILVVATKELWMNYMSTTPDVLWQLMFTARTAILDRIFVGFV